MKRIGYVAAGAVIVALGLLAGCNQQTQGTSVKVHLRDDWGTPTAANVIYQVGNGEWQLAAQDDFGEYSFTLPPGEKRYGVAVNCIPNLHGLRTLAFYTIYQLTSDDATEVTIPCFNFTNGPSVTTAKINWDASALSGNYFKVYTPVSVEEGSSSPIKLDSAVGDDQPFLFLAYDSNNDDYSGLVGVRYDKIDVGPEESISVTMTSSDAAAFGSIEGPQTPNGFSDCGVRGAIYTHDGLQATDLAEAGGNPCQGSFLKIPGLSANDDYIFLSTYRDTGTDRALAELSVLPAANLDKYEMADELPSPWPANYSVQPAALPTFKLNHPDGGVAGYMISYFAQGGGPWWTIFISPAWLDGNDEYTIPDMTSIPGFGGARPLSDEVVEWEVFALFSDTPLGEVLNSPHWTVAGGPVWIPVPSGLHMTGASKAGAYPVP